MFDMSPATSGKNSPKSLNSKKNSMKENQVDRSQQITKTNETMQSCEFRQPFGEKTQRLNNQQPNRMIMHSAKMRESNKPLHAHVDHVFRDSQLSSADKVKRNLERRASAPSLPTGNPTVHVDVDLRPQRPGTFNRKQTLDPPLSQLEAIQEPNIIISIDRVSLTNHIAVDELELNQVTGGPSHPIEEYKRSRTKSSNRNK